MAVPEYARVVTDLAVRRKLVDVCATATQAASSAMDKDCNAIAAELEHNLHQLQEVSAVGTGIAAGRASTAFLTAMEAQMNGQGDPMLTFGLAAVDEALGPVGAEDVIVLGGRTSMGKSAVAQQLAMKVAMQGKGVGFFALEMSQDQMAARMLAALAQPTYGMLPYSKIYRARAGLDKVDASDMMALRRAASDLNLLPMFIDTRGGLRPSEVMAACRRLKRNCEKRGAPLSLIVIDHIGEMTPDHHCTSDYERASSIARWLKQATKALQVPILACVQINREAEKTNDKKPNRSMLRDSGRIEEIADSILLVHREAFYLERAKPPMSDQSAYVQWRCDHEKVQNKLTLICDKARMGRPGVAELWFCPGTTRLEDTGAAA